MTSRRLPTVRMWAPTDRLLSQKSISVTADLTVWTNGRTFWCTHRSQRHTWPAEHAEAAAARLAALAAAS
jgi:hypothetical protein